MLRIQFIFWIAATAVLGAAPLPRVKVGPNGEFQTQDGKVIVFHGTSFVNKEDDMVIVSDEEMEFISTKLGFNAVRVGFLWNLLETKPGVYNQTYLNALESLVNRFATHGIYSLLDMHQDLWAPQFCGHGLPDFYALPENIPGFMKNGEFAFPQPIVDPTYSDPGKQQGAFPYISNCDQAQAGLLGWGGVYMSYALSSAAQRLYDNDGGILDKFGDMWELIAKRFKNNTGVMGYELLNEPWIGDGYRHPELFLPAKSDQKNMQKMNRYLHDRIRKIDDQQIIFFEPSAGGNMPGSPGYTEGPGGAGYNDRQALSYHLYCPKLDLTINTKNPILNTLIKSVSPWLVDEECQLTYKSEAGSMIKAVKSIGCGGLLTEFGAESGSRMGVWDAINGLQSIMDHNFAGWIYWELSNHVTDITQIDTTIVRHLTRTFARTISGIPVDMSFEDSTGAFQLTYQLQPTSTQTPTEIFYNPTIHYPHGAKCDVTPADSAKCDLDANARRAIVTNLKPNGAVTIQLTALSQ